MKRFFYYFSFAVLMTGITMLSAVFGYWYIGAIISGVFALGLIMEYFHVKKQRHCPKCKKLYDFEKDISYKEISTKRKTFRINPESKSKRQMRSMLKHKLQFDCLCSECGTKNQFKQEIDGAITYSDGSYEDNDVEHYIESYFKEGETAGQNKNMGFQYLFGIVMIAISIFMQFSDLGAGINIKKVKDPADYYGTYYAETDLHEYYTFEFSDTKCIVYIGNGTTSNVTEEWKYEYVSAKYAVARLGDNAKYDTKDAILIYSPTQNNYAITLWVMENTPNNYTFETNEGNVKVNKTPYIIGGAKDPQDYYGTYKLDSSNYITINKDGTASLTIDDNTTDWSYIYANASYMKSWITGSHGTSLLLYHYNESVCSVFNINSKNSLIYNGYTFIKE